MFKPEDIAEYYDSTQIHYKQWWDLKKNRSLHYGIWSKGVKNFRQASENSNKILFELANISDKERILDAGCGVGGSAIYMSKQKEVSVTGITLSKAQLELGRAIILEEGLDHRVDLQLMDYTNTLFEDESFDVVWACESVSSCPDKSLFIREAHRVLKPGGRLIISDFFLSNENQNDPNNWMKKWGATWAISGFISSNHFTKLIDESGFGNTKTFNYTKEIRKSARRMYIASLLAALPSEAYNLIKPNVSRFAKGHYKCGIYQYRALKENLWQYEVISSVKNTLANN